MSESFAVWEGVRFGNSVARAGDFFFDTEAFGEATYEGGFAGTDVTNKFKNRAFKSCGQLFAIV